MQVLMDGHQQDLRPAGEIEYGTLVMDQDGDPCVVMDVPTEDEDYVRLLDLRGGFTFVVHQGDELDVLSPDRKIAISNEE